MFSNRVCAIRLLFVKKKYLYENWKKCRQVFYDSIKHNYRMQLHLYCHICNHIYLYRKINCAGSMKERQAMHIFPVTSSRPRKNLSLYDVPWIKKKRNLINHSKRALLKIIYSTFLPIIISTLLKSVIYSYSYLSLFDIPSQKLNIAC